MKIHQTDLQKKLAKYPSQLDFLQVLNYRGSDYFEKQKKRYRSLRTGEMGEQKVIEYLRKYGERNWVVLQNIWLDHFGTFECDIILLTKHCLYVFEVKNYTGKFIYDNGKCYFDDYESSLNPIEQVRSNLVDLRNIYSRRFPHLPVKAAAIFVGKDNEVQIDSSIDDIQAVNRTQLRNFILDIVREERTERAHRIHFDQIIGQLTPYEIANPYIHAPLTALEMKEIRGGLHCSHCDGFNLKMSKFKVHCSCGMTESKEEAIIRTICDYGVLNYQSDLIRKELYKMLDAQISVTTLSTVLHKHFDVIHNNAYTYYMNKRQLYQKSYRLFDIKQGRTYTTSDDEVIILKQGQIMRILD